MQFLHHHGNDVAKNQCTFTQVFKITKKLIRFLGDVVPHLNPARELFCDICSSIMVYTKNMFHAMIQNTAVDALTKLHLYKADVVWLLCRSLYDSDIQTHHIENLLLEDFFVE